MQLNLLLKRIRHTEKSTIGEMSIDGVFQCYTLEDKEREVKIKNVTAIPKGTYNVVIDMSTRFAKLMPHILNVPNFEGIRIHSGNKSEDTEGCILVGKVRYADSIGSSKVAFAELFKKMQLADKITITIE